MPKSSCPHVITIGEWSPEDIAQKERRSSCETCGESEAGLWCCLHGDCGYVGCGEKRADHSAAHFSSNQEHSLMINLKSKRIWCHTCETEVYLDNNVPAPCRSSLNPDISESERPSDDLIQRPLGLAGLQNLGNTCYMNAALQALSNCPQLTRYFLNAPISPQVVRADGRTQNANLAVSYSKMIRQMWHERRPPYAVPSGVAYGIKSVCPVFRGAAQQDAQEFLRCFLDQLHDELKREYVPKRSAADDGGDEGVDRSAGLDPGQQHQRSTQPRKVRHECRGEQRRQRSRAQRHQPEEIADEDEEDIQALTVQSSSVLRGREEVRPGDEDDLEVKIDDEPVDIDESDDVDEEMPTSSYEETGRRERGVGSGSRKIGRQPPHGSADGRPQQDQHPHQHAHVHQQDNPEDDFETCDSGLSSEKSEASASDKNNIADNQRAYETSLCTLLMGELQKAIASAGVSTVSGGAAGVSAIDSKKPSVSYRSIISDVFDGRLLSSVQCFTCESISSTKEVFQDLSLPIPSRDHLERLHHVPPQSGDLSSASSTSSLNSLAAVQVHQQQSLSRQQGWMEWLFGWLWSWVWGPSVSLTDCLAAFFSADELKGDNMYSCGKCNKLRNGIKYSKLLELPEVLCIHLKRFRHELLFSTKISSRVSFPLEGLDMAPFTHPHARDEVTLYDLVAVICHHGTASSGHYTSYAKNEYDEQWYEFDDTYVSKVDPSVVATCEAYVLFYRKTSEEMVKRRDHAADLIDRSRCEQLDMSSPTFYISSRWVNRFNTFAEPGPIDNDEFVCPHGQLNPSVCDGDLVLFSQSVWEYLRETFKGGPAITSTERCPYCLDIQRVLLERRLATFAFNPGQQHQQQQHRQQTPTATGATPPGEDGDARQLQLSWSAAGGDPAVTCQLEPSGTLRRDRDVSPSSRSDKHVESAHLLHGALQSRGCPRAPQKTVDPMSGDFAADDEEPAPMDTSDTDEVKPQLRLQTLKLRQLFEQLKQDQKAKPDPTLADDEDEEVFSVERPASIAIDNLLDNVVFKMNSARVTDLLSVPSPASGAAITDIEQRNGEAHDGDSAFCSPMDSVNSRGLFKLPERRWVHCDRRAGIATLHSGDATAERHQFQHLCSEHVLTVCPRQEGRPGFRRGIHGNELLLQQAYLEKSAFAGQKGEKSLIIARKTTTTDRHRGCPVGTCPALPVYKKRLHRSKTKKSTPRNFLRDEFAFHLLDDLYFYQLCWLVSIFMAIYGSPVELSKGLRAAIRYRAYADGIALVQALRQGNGQAAQTIFYQGTSCDFDPGMLNMGPFSQPPRFCLHSECFTLGLKVND
ncbi:ubiquitin carboxyl-terminal hydrolase 20-like [Tropilaelaps mercedesae]|uniref:ubiquitinyl hydrolase 1 n=1 Tax=Tropilaelaps mercedesae TaxID=418985 RepID=A0A1V9XU25_9ACAR|nr:ubiquitin carboxyl-terminal hydrolase 20-like [Tropilaelaps mercedesae]